MYYKEKQDFMPGKQGDRLWRPEVVRTGRLIDINQLSQHISSATTLTKSDIAAVLFSLSEYMDL